MSFYAYRDKARTQIVFATEVTIKDNNTRFYCGNPNCDAILKFRSESSVIEKRACFFALKSKPHMKGCSFESNINPFKPTKYDEALFEFIPLINEYIQGDIKIIKRRLFTLSQIFFMCKSKNINDIYGDTNIWKILCDNRSNKIYKKGILGVHLVECKFHKYNSKETSIFFKYPLDDTKDNKYDIKISFADDPALFLFVKRKVYNTNNSPIIIAGEWHWEDGYLTTSFTNKHQLYTPFTKI